MEWHFLGNSQCLLNQILLLLKALQASSSHHIATTCSKRQSFSHSYNLFFSLHQKKSAETWDLIRKTWHCHRYSHWQSITTWPAKMVPFGLVPLLSSLLSHSFFFFLTPPEGSIPIVSLSNSFLAYNSPWSTPEASHNSLLISLFSCRIRRRSTHWDQAVRTETEIVLVAWNIWLPVDEDVITYLLSVSNKEKNKIKSS